MPNPGLPTSLAPWLAVRKGAQAVDFYKTAFGAVEVYRLENPGGMVVRLSVDGAEFWVSDGAEGHRWRLGRMVDPLGLPWEIGRPL